MRRVVITLGIVAILVSSCGRSDPTASFETRLQEQVASIRALAEEGKAGPRARPTREPRRIGDVPARPRADRRGVGTRRSSSPPRSSSCSFVSSPPLRSRKRRAPPLSRRNKEVRGHDGDGKDDDKGKGNDKGKGKND